MKVKRFLFLMPLIVLALAYGCTKERATDPGDNGGDNGGGDAQFTCVGCHTEEDSIKAHLPDEGGVPRIANRGDG